MPYARIVTKLTFVSDMVCVNGAVYFFFHVSQQFVFVMLQAVGLFATI